MSDTLVILGRQPALGIAELESLYGGERVKPFGDSAAVVAGELVFDRLGGALKAGTVLTSLDHTNWGKIERHLVKLMPDITSSMPEGKIQLGISVYGSAESAQRIMATGLSIKKAIKKAGRSVRLTPNQEPALSSAQVFHNHLTGPTGLELTIVQDKTQTIIARTTAVQDIDAYTQRDRDRPKRDTRVGMLPPKLAQILINLAVGTAKPAVETTILDPFCGTGVVLQESVLMGFSAYGTDLEERMIDYSDTNLDWLATKVEISADKPQLAQGDATNYQWQPIPDFVACETYLGKPFTETPTNEALATTVTDCNLIIKKFLRNIANQTKPGTRLCVAVPAWQVRPGQFKHLPLIDQISEMGYNRVSFEHSRAEQLLYYREDQIVARELLVITRQ